MSMFKIDRRSRTKPRRTSKRQSAIIRWRRAHIRTHRPLFLKTSKRWLTHVIKIYNKTHPWRRRSSWKSLILFTAHKITGLTTGSMIISFFMGPVILWSWQRSRDLANRVMFSRYLALGLMITGKNWENHCRFTKSMSGGRDFPKMIENFSNL